MKPRIFFDCLSELVRECGFAIRLARREQSLDAESLAGALSSSLPSIPGVSVLPSLFLFVKHMLERSKSFSGSKKDNNCKNITSNYRDKQLIKSFIKSSLSNMEKNALWYLSSQKIKGD